VTSRARFVTLLVASLVLAGCRAGSEGTPGAPTSTPGPLTAGIARAEDDVQHVDARTEWWYVHAVDPRTGRAVVAIFSSAPFPIVSGYLLTRTGGTNWLAPTELRDHAGPGVALGAGSVGYDAASKRWLVDQQAKGYRIHLVLSRSRPGITTSDLRFGDQSERWSVPVATSRADGWIVEPGGRRIEVRDWYGYHDHNWGNFDLESHAYLGWEWAAVHEPGGRAWVLAAIKRLDGSYFTVLVRVTPANTTFCRAKLTVRRWMTSDQFRLPAEVMAGCGQERVTFLVTRPFVHPLTTYALTESIGRSDQPRSIGIIEHLGRKTDK
jgi:hypothetical protein